MEAPAKRIPKSLGKLRKWLLELLRFVLQSQVVRGDNYEVHQTDNGTQLLIDLGGAGGGGGDDLVLDFQTITQTAADGSSQWGVVSQSHLYKSSGKFDDEQDVNGIFDAPDPAATDPGWMAVPPDLPAYLYMKGTIATWPDLSDVSVFTGVASDLLGGMVEYQMTTPPGSGAPYPQQTFFRLALAKAEDDGAGNTIFTPLHTGALILDIMPRMGNLSDGSTPLQVPCVFPVPL